MHDTYPGAEPDPGPIGASKVNAIVYRHIHGALDGDRSSIPRPASQSGRVVLSRLGKMGGKGVEAPRLAVISGLAHIDGSRRAEAAEVEAHEELVAIMEEAPGA